MCHFRRLFEVPLQGTKNLIFTPPGRCLPVRAARRQARGYDEHALPGLNTDAINTLSGCPLADWSRRFSAP